MANILAQSGPLAATGDGVHLNPLGHTEGAVPIRAIATTLTV